MGINKCSEIVINRDLQIDNIKGLLIVFVVLGHVLSVGFRGENVISTILYCIIYSFHMPCFFFVSGYLFRKNIGKDASFQNQRLIVCYVFGCVLVVLVKSLIYQELMIFNPIFPSLAMWYLLSLFFMRILAPWLIRVRCVIILSVFISLMAGMFDCIDDMLSISRTICLLPFFVMGLKIDDNKIKYLREIKTKFKAIIFLVAVSAEALFVSMMYRSGWNYNIVWMKEGYSNAGLSNTEGIITRGALILTAITMCVFLLTFTTSKRLFLTKVGRNSLSVYMIHVIFIFILPEAIDNFDFVLDYNWSFAIAVLITAVIVTTLSLDIVSDTLNKIINKLSQITYNYNNTQTFNH